MFRRHHLVILSVFYFFISVSRKKLNLTLFSFNGNLNFRWPMRSLLLKTVRNWDSLKVNYCAAVAKISRIMDWRNWGREKKSFIDEIMDWDLNLLLWWAGLNELEPTCLLNRFNITNCFDCRDHCKECCQKDTTAPTLKKYPRAVLEVCTCKFGAYPQIQAFIKSDRPSKFPNLQIKYVRGLGE